MTHREAIETDAVDRYILGSMAREEVIDFEEHALVCEQCRAAVNQGEAFAGGLRTLMAVSLRPEENQPQKIAKRWWEILFFWR
jgi:hypothetical protein